MERVFQIRGLSFMSSVVSRLATLAGVLVFVAGCQSVPATYTPDPALKSASPAQLRAKVTSTCVLAQRGKSSLTTGELQSKCGCYASGAFKAMSKDDVTFYRTNGYFSDASRPAAQKALNACGLQ